MSQANALMFPPKASKSSNSLATAVSKVHQTKGCIHTCQTKGIAALFQQLRRRLYNSLACLPPKPNPSVASARFVSNIVACAESWCRRVPGVFSAEFEFLLFIHESLCTQLVQSPSRPNVSEYLFQIVLSPGPRSSRPAPLETGIHLGSLGKGRKDILRFDVLQITKGWTPSSGNRMMKS